MIKASLALGIAPYIHKPSGFWSFLSTHHTANLPHKQVGVGSHFRSSHHLLDKKCSVYLKYWE